MCNFWWNCQCIVHHLELNICGLDKCPIHFLIAILDNFPIWQEVAATTFRFAAVLFNCCPSPHIYIAQEIQMSLDGTPAERTIGSLLGSWVFVPLLSFTPTSGASFFFFCLCIQSASEDEFKTEKSSTGSWSISFVCRVQDIMNAFAQIEHKFTFHQQFRNFY